MDTRSMIRSRRRSTRLTGQSPQDEPARQPTKRKKRTSGHKTSGHSNSSASSSRESSPGTDTSSKNASLSPDSHPNPQGNETAKATTTEASEDDDDGVVSPLFPNLPLSQPNVAAFDRAETESITASRKESVDAPSEDARKDHASNKWVKTARGSIKLASDGPPEASKDEANKKLGEVHEGQSVRSAAARRRSRRLASLSPDVMEETIEVQPLPPRRHRTIKAESSSPDVMEETIEVQPLPFRGHRKVKAESPSPVAEVSDEPEESEDELQDSSAKPTTKKGRSTRQTRHDEPPSHDGKTAGPADEEADGIKNVAPIPELLADIERIILSSPLAARDPANDGTKGTSSPTPAPAVEKQAPAGIPTRSRALRSSSRLIDAPAGIGKSLDHLDSVDLDSSQLDGAYDESIQDNKSKRGQVKHGKATAVMPSEPRGTKRSVEQELPEPEGPAPAPATRLPRTRALATRLPRTRTQASGHSNTPELDLSSFNPIEAATSRDAFAVDDPNVESSVSISDFARQSGEPPNPVTLAHMISSNSPTQAEGDYYILTPTRAQQPSSPEMASSSDAYPAQGYHHHGPVEEEASPPQNPDVASPSDADPAREHNHGSEEEEASPQEADDNGPLTCDDCGRAPARYIVCARCLNVIYCGKYCQLWGWPSHKPFCVQAEEAVRAQVDAQETYLGDMWAGALRMLDAERNGVGDGALESLLMGEAVRHSAARRAAPDQGRRRGFGSGGGMAIGGPSSQARFAVPPNEESLEGSRAMSIQMARDNLAREENDE